MPDSSFYKQTTLPGFAKEKSTSPLPQQIGPYKIESLLNKGGMSLLYLGLDPTSKQPLAVKVLPPEYVNHKEAIARFLKEAEIIKRTNHPNIVKLFGEGEWEGGLYIAMEFIRGVSLKQFIIQQSLSLKRTLDIILQVAYALSHLHAHGMVHRDLKPENILITEDGAVKVIDFGIAQLHEEKEIEKEIAGTPGYMSPEQKENPHNVTYASDIYSLGVIAYELIIGKLSYGTINLSLLPPHLRKIIAKALAISMEERYKDIVEFITDISQYLKSGEWEKERPGSDQIKEIQEQIQKTENTLSSPLPSWDFLDFGFAKAKGAWTPGLYYDFFRLPNNLYLFLIASSSSSSVESSIHIANLRGMIHMLIHEKITSPKTPFASVSFVTTLNQQICEDRTNQHFHLSLLVLDPLRDQLAFLTCGLGPLIHLPEGTAKPRVLGLPHLSLGTDPLATFSLTTDNWYTGDILFFHSLLSSAFGTDLEKKFLDAISENAFISPQHQSESIFKKMNGYPSFANLNHPKILFSINRIS